MVGINGTTSEPLLKARDIELRFKGTVAIDGLSVDVLPGEVFGIIGPNGAGKTSFLNCISGFYHPQKGTITFAGQQVSGQPPHRIARLGIGRTFQHTELFRNSTVLENLMLGRHVSMKTNVFSAAVYLRWAQREDAEHRKAVEEVIEFLEIQKLRYRTVGSLAFGQQKLVEIGRALAMSPTLILLDEPSAGMNREEKEDVARFILRIKHELKLTQVLIEHDMRFVSDLCDRVVALDFGQKIAEGKPEEVLRHPSVISAYLGVPNEPAGVHAGSSTDPKTSL